MEIDMDKIIHEASEEICNKKIQLLWWRGKPEDSEYVNEIITRHFSDIKERSDIMDSVHKETMEKLENLKSKARAYQGNGANTSPMEEMRFNGYAPGSATIAQHKCAFCGSEHQMKGVGKCICQNSDCLAFQMRDLAKE